MKVLKFTKSKEKEWREFIRKYNNVREFDILNGTTFPSDEKEIYLIVEKGWIRKYRLISYCIIEKDIDSFVFLNMIDESYKCENNIVYITDFLVRISKRNMGIGKQFAEYILDEVCKDKNVILNPDGDGNWFWKKFGFVDDGISKNKTLILNRESN